MLISKKKLLILEDIAKMKTLIPIQKEIVTALEQMKEKALITEANLAKKVRENFSLFLEQKAWYNLVNYDCMTVRRTA